MTREEEIQEELLKSIEKYLSIKNTIKGINEMVAPEYVSEPIAVNVSQWNEYSKKKNQYDQVVYAKSVGLKKEESELEELKLSIIKMLPKSNIWFVLDNEKYAIGHRSNDWPGHLGDLLIVEKPKVSELKKINHQIIN